MSDLIPVEKARADAMTSLKSPENEERLKEYAIPEMKVAVFGVYPAGIGPASVIVAYFSRIGRNVTSHTYRSGDRFRKNDVEGRRILAVKESSYTNGIKQIGEAAEEAINKGYIERDDFRLLIADTFTMLTVDAVLLGSDEPPKEPYSA